MKCASCYGSGQVLKVDCHPSKEDASRRNEANVDWVLCPECHGSGEVNDVETEWMPPRATLRA